MNNISIFACYLLLALPLFTTALFVSLPKKNPCLFALHQSLSFIWFALAVFFFLSGKSFTLSLGNWPAPYTITLLFDRLSAVMLALFSTVLVSITFYSKNDLFLSGSKKSYYIGYWLLLFAVTGAICTTDLFNLYVWLELILASCFILFFCTIKPSARLFLHYAILNITGTLILLLAIGLLYGYTGSLQYQMIHAFAEKKSILTLSLFSLLLFGLAVKGAFFPLYFWLPISYPATSTSSRLLLSSLVTKTVMIVLVRLIIMCGLFLHKEIQDIVFVIACITMVAGVMGAAIQSKLQHILSFHIISQLGYVLLALSISSSIAIVSALFFLIHNIVVKTNLFMVTGLIEEHYQTDSLSKMGNLLKNNFWLAVIFFISCLSLAGIPPLSGFWAKFLVIKVSISHSTYSGAAFAIFVSLLTLYSMLKIWRYLFCEKTDEKMYQSDTVTISQSKTTGLLLLVIITILIGIYPDFLLNALQESINALQTI